jgi:hypothetical protein
MVAYLARRHSWLDWLWELPPHPSSQPAAAIIALWWDEHFDPWQRTMLSIAVAWASFAFLLVRVLRFP